MRELSFDEIDEVSGGSATVEGAALACLSGATGFVMGAYTAGPVGWAAFKQAAAAGCLIGTATYLINSL